jgi:hypothetical protein
MARLELSNLPIGLNEIIERIPSLGVHSDGLLVTWHGSDPSQPVLLYRTQWNQDNDTAGDRLLQGIRKGIVLHWYGDRDNFDRSIDGYLRGFDSLRKVGDYLTRTSAHFLVGDSIPVSIPICAPLQ